MKIDLSESYNMINSGTVADVLDEYSISGVLSHAIKRVNNGAPLMIGRAYTIQWGAVRKGRDIKSKMQSSWDQVKAFLVPEVNSGRGLIYCAGVEEGLLCDYALAGGLSVTDFFNREFSGVILGGAVRDASTILSVDMPVYSTNFIPSDSQGNYAVKSTGTYCTIGGVRINTGDLIFADETGIVVVPQDLEDSILKRALEIEGIEKKIVELINSGNRLFDIVEKIGRI